MRNLEERIAEIDRRSEEILKKRIKRRKQIFSVCIGLELCLLTTVLYLGGGTPEPEVIPTQKGEHTLGGETDGETKDFVSPEGIYYQKTVKVVGTGWFRYYRSNEEVDQILQALSKITDTPVVDTIPEGDSATDTGGVSNSPICEIAVTDIGGATRIYYVYETKLVEKETGKYYIMTQEAAKELQKALALL